MRFPQIEMMVWCTHKMYPFIACGWRLYYILWSRTFILLDTLVNDDRNLNLSKHSFQNGYSHSLLCTLLHRQTDHSTRIVNDVRPKSSFYSTYHGGPVLETFFFYEHLLSYLLRDYMIEFISPVQNTTIFQYFPKGAKIPYYSTVEGWIRNSIHCGIHSDYDLVRRSSQSIHKLRQSIKK